MYKCEKCEKSYSREDFYLKHIEKCGVEEPIEDQTIPYVDNVEFIAQELAEMELREKVKAEIERKKNEEQPTRTYTKQFGKFRCSQCRKYFFTEKLFQKHTCK